MRKALIRQIVAAIDKQYIEELNHPTLNIITKPIYDVLTYLFDNFADVTASDVSKEEEKLRTYYWNVTEPPLIFYTLINDLQTLAKAANETKTDQQLINLGLEIIQKTGDMEKGLAEWHNRDVAEHTWGNFKRHFSHAHRELRKIRGKSMKTTHFHQAHSIVDDINANISDLHNEIRDTLSTYTSDANTTTTAPSPTSTLTHTANSVTTNDLLQMILQMQKQLNQQQGLVPYQSNASYTSENNKKKKTFIRNLTDHYCWTHGA